MAEYRVPTQAELDRLLYMQGMQGKSNQQIIDENLARGTTIQSLPENFFQTASAGARRVGDYVNQLGNAQQIVNKLFPSELGNTKATIRIPTNFNFAAKQSPTGEIMPAGLQTQSVPVASILQAIKPADVLGISGAERAYGDIGAGKAPQPLDVVDTLGLGAGLTAAGRLAVKGGMATGRYIAPELGNMAEQYAAKTGLLQSIKPIDAVQPQAGTGLLQTAPRSEIGFYSAVEQAAMASPRKSATGQAFLNDIMKGQDVRADEIKWMGLDDYLKGKQNVTKQEVQDYIANNRVNVQEVRLGKSVAEDPIGIAKRKAIFDKYEPEIQALYKQIDSLGYGTPFNVYYELDNKLRKLLNARDLEADAAYVVPEAIPTIPTEFGQYTLPGGENYRELLLTMPTSEGSKLYRSSHFNQPNILAHLRVNDRIDADGKKMLLIEEVQSDWHQAGREQGYAVKTRSLNEIDNDLDKVINDLRSKPGVSYSPSDADWAKYPEITAKHDALSRERNLVSNKKSDAVPDAPFKDTWYQLALKRAIQHAAENGYDRIGLTTGSQQAARFDLSKQIDAIKYNQMPDGRIFWTAEKNGQRVTGGDNAPNELDGVVGKEVAQKIRQGAESGKPGTLSGLDLKVGGEGMKKYYDEIYPKFLEKYGKKWGAKIGETKIRTQSDKQALEDLDLLEQLGEDRSKFSSSGMTGVRYLDITPEMKAGVSKGQPLFAAVPAIPAAGLLAPQEQRR
jgi:hypothetical protein